MKKIIAIIATISIIFTSIISVNAREMNMYVRNQNVVRDVVDVNGFDMLPIADIAGELGFYYAYYGGSRFELYNGNNGGTMYIFNIGDASVYDQNGGWHGLDVVPQVINGKVRIPAKFLQDTFGLSYVWDSVTDTLFIGSENTYNWLRSTPEYQAAARGEVQAAPSTPTSSYSKYPNSPFRTFTDVIGISAQSSSTTSTGSVIYEYGYTALDSVYTYMSVLQNDGMTYYGSEERGSAVIITFFDKNNNMLLIMYDSSTGNTKVLVS